MTAKPCANCGKPATPRHAPFCSRRCSELDLGRWLSDRYVVPAAPPAPDGAELGED